MFYFLISLLPDQVLRHPTRAKFTVLQKYANNLVSPMHDRGPFVKLHDPKRIKSSAVRAA